MHTNPDVCYHHLNYYLLRLYINDVDLVIDSKLYTIFLKSHKIIFTQSIADCNRSFVFIIYTSN